jgi:hypothetical protein
MRNATVGALMYEFLFEVYRKMDDDRKRGSIRSLPDEKGTLREAFNHEGMGCWEWTSGALENVGVLKALQPTPRQWGPFFYPVMNLDECGVADFSKFETFDNYCVAMFSFRYLHNQLSGLFTAPGQVNLRIRSPRFLEAVASQDDIFLIEDSDHVRFDKPRYEEKVITRWRGGLDDRNIRPKSGA